MQPDVWAPTPDEVVLVLGDGRRLPLERHPDGWWRGGPELGPGDRYGFSLDGSEPFPDPRSRWQPDGVHGLSAVDDPAGFTWSDDGWAGVELLGGVIYELHVGTFTPAGDLDGAIDRLDHLVGLGVTAVELMPVAEAMGRRGWGYDGVDLWAVHHVYGGPAALRRFVDAAHARGLGVLLDVVYNHLGPEGSYLDRFGPYFTDRHETPWGAAVCLDGPESSEPRRFIVDNALHWCTEHHIDGLRVDATHHLLDDSPVHVVAELAAAVHELGRRTGRPRWVVIEREQPEHGPLRPVTDGGWGVDARWADDLHHALHAYLTGESDGYYAPFGRLADIATVLVAGHLPPGEPRPPDVPPRRLVTCAQNHDQIGNRAGGERLVHLVGPPAAMAAAALVLLGPGTPLLFQGEEWAASTPFPYFCDPSDPELAESIRAGRRAEFEGFGWAADAVADPVSPATFCEAVLDWDERERPTHRVVLDWYRALIHLRRAEPALATGGDAWVEVDEEHRTLVLHRSSYAVAAHLGAGDAFVQVDVDVVLAAVGAVRVDAGGLRLGPWTTAVVRTAA
jgi:maltooligosyltrehalose trehalohydrolase